MWSRPVSGRTRPIVSSLTRAFTGHLLSPDQKITRRKGGKLVIQFSATSEPEVLNWVLSLGVEAKLIEPVELVEQLKEQLAGVGALYT